MKRSIPTGDSHIHRVPFKEMLALGAGDFAAVLYWTTFMKFLPIFYTDVFGLSAALTGSMLLWSRMIDGISDVVIGSWADRTETRWGKFRPFVIFAAVPFAIAGVLTFTTPDLGPTGKLIWALLTYNLLMVLYTTFNIPATALMGVMTNDPVQRTRLSSMKFVFAFSAGFVISIGLLPLVDVLGGLSNPQRGWQLAYVLIGVVAVILLWVTGFGVKERIKPEVNSTDSLGRDLKYLVSNIPWLIVLATTLTWILFIALRSSVSSHYFKYFIFDGSLETKVHFLFWDFNFTSLTSAFFGVGQGISVITALMIAGIASRMSKRILFIIMVGIQTLTTGVYYFLQPDQLFLIFALEILGNIGGAGAPVLLWAMYAESADYGEWKFRRRTTGLIFSASTMSQKFGWGIAAWIGLSVLSWTGFVANEIPSPEVKHGLVLLMSLVPMAFGILSLLIFLCYPLNEKKMMEINRDIAARKQV